MIVKSKRSKGVAALLNKCSRIITNGGKMLPIDETTHKGDLVEIPQTVDELKALTRKLGYKENHGGGLDVYDGGYHAWYAPPDWDEAIKDIQSRNLDWVKTEDDLSELVFDVMYGWFLNSSG